MTQEVSKEIDAQKYFDELKTKKQNTTDQFLLNLYENTEVLLKKAFALGQLYATRKLIFTLETLEKERELYNLGCRTFIYRDDIEHYIDKVSAKAVKIIELENYPREIPDEVASQLIEFKQRNIFSQYYVVFTDYTGETSKELKAEQKRKDPILFGTFMKKDTSGTYLHDRFYYIADWEDEYCDLTLARMTAEMTAKGKSIKQPVCIPDASIQTIRDYLTQLEESAHNIWRVHSAYKKKSFFDKLKFWES